MVMPSSSDMNDTDIVGALPAFPFIEIDETGQPNLVAVRCRNCGATYAGPERTACARCLSRGDVFERYTPSRQGTLHSAAIVHRAYPGIEVPFISAIVDLDDGPTLKGVLRAASFEPEEIGPGRRVEVCFDDALGRTDKAGQHYVSHYFAPLA